MRRKKAKKGMTIAARVHTLVTKGLATDQYRSVHCIATRLGWSESLVRSTLNRINEFEVANATHVLSYDPKTQCWKLAATWEKDKEFYVGWLMRNIATRVDTVTRHVEVADGLVIDHKKIPPALLKALNALEAQADVVLSLLPEPSKTPAPMLKVPTRKTFIK
jgi:hypothetical protein